MISLVKLNNQLLSSQEFRKVLIVTGDFVPVSSNCTFRTMGFAEELPKFGWNPFILTQHPKNSDWTIDYGLKSDCPTFEVSGNEFLWRVLKKTSPIVPSWLLADRARSWIPFAVAKGVYLTLRHNIDVIFGSFQPWSSLVAAYLISLLTRRPLVSEYRDPIPNLIGDSVATKRRLSLARKIIRHSSGVVTTTAEISRNIQMLAGIPPSDRTLVLPHGYRRDDFSPLDVPPVSKFFTITFTGSFYVHQCVDTFCRAIAGFLQANPNLIGRVRLKIIGRQKSGAFEYLWNSARLYGIEDCIEILPWQTQQQLRNTIYSSHIVWCSDVGRSKIIPGKLAKMFACGRPLIAFCSIGSATWRAVEETVTGSCFECDDVLGVQRFIEKIYQTATNGNYLPNRNEKKLQDYSFQSLTTMLVNLFNKVSLDQKSYVKLKHLKS